MDPSVEERTIKYSLVEEFYEQNPSIFCKSSQDTMDTVMNQVMADSETVNAPAYIPADLHPDILDSIYGTYEW